jgi:nucleoid-associated protein YgaU
MRKDVRMGFAVGGVLLAVIIVAVLVIHRNHNNSKVVAFDPGKGSAAPAGATNDPAAPDVTPAKAPDAPTELAAANVPAANVPPVAAHEDAATPTSEQPKAPTDDATDKSGARWDALFASTSEDPLKSQLTSGSSKTKNHRSAPAAEAVANGQIEAGSRPMTARPSQVTVMPPSSVSTGDSPRTHKVAAGETFVSISRVVYGDGKYFQAIVDANPTVPPRNLKPGMVIQLPSAAQVKKAKAAKSGVTAAASGPALASDGKTYTVQSGDNLYKIARKLYGNGEKGADLYALNKQVIGPDSTKLKVGMVLKLPQTPTASASR